MSEIRQRWEALAKLVICVIFAFLYAYAGEHGTPLWLRRYLAPSLLIGSMFYFVRDWKVFIQLPVMFASLSLGYGGGTLWEKIWRRASFGSANGLSSSIYNGLCSKWLLFVTQIVLVTSLYIIMGVWNPLPDARTEELFLGFIIPFIPLMSARRKENA
jgi:hypothetical protein